MGKKEAFRKIRTGGYEFYAATPEMQESLHINAFSMDGIFVHEPYCCSKLYSIARVNSIKFTQFLFEIRNLDAAMQIQSRSQGSGELWLAFYLYDEDMKTIYTKFGQLEQKLQIMCSACNYIYSATMFEDRMKYTLTELILGIGAINAAEFSCPDTFFSENVSWVQELILERKYDFLSENVYRNIFKAPNKKEGYYKICYLRAIAGFKNLDALSSAFANDYIRSIGITLIPVSDFGQSVRHQATYLDYESTYARLRRREDPILDTLTNFVPDKDSHEYLLFGCIFVICGTGKDEISELYIDIKRQLDKSGVELDEIYGSELFSCFLSALPAGINIQTYPLRQAHRKFIEAASFSLYPYKTSDMVTNKENDEKWLDQIIV